MASNLKETWCRVRTSSLYFYEFEMAPIFGNDTALHWYVFFLNLFSQGFANRPYNTQVKALLYNQ